MQVLKSGESDIRFLGEGTGKQTTDGCSVDFYLKLKAGNEPDLICAHLHDGASVLDLGCGVGRVTNALVHRGLTVTAVDNSPEMLAHVRGADVVCSDIETLELETRFDAVVLGSFLLNTPMKTVRRALLRTCQKYLKDEGVVFIECHPYPALETTSPGFKGDRDGIKTTVESVGRRGTTLDLKMRWEIANEIWTQTFSTEILSETDIRNELKSCDLFFQRWLDEKGSWMMARRV